VEGPERRQRSKELVDLEQLVSEEHPVRAVWAFVVRLDLREYHDEIEKRGSVPERPAKDPKPLLALWLYATSEAVGSARLLSRLCERDAPHRWLCSAGAARPGRVSLVSARRSRPAAPAARASWASRPGRDPRSCPS
jgi:transposase